MKKYISCFILSAFLCCGLVFATPEDHDESFQTFNEIGVTNANIGSNGVINVTAAAPGGKFFIGGDFTLYKGTTVNRFTRINSDGSLDTSFSLIVDTAVATAIGFNGAINTIAIAPGATEQKYTVFVGGAFTQVRGKVQNRLAKLDCTTTGCRLDTTFVSHLATSGATGAINAITFAPGGTAENYQVIIGGLFPKFNNFNQNNISRITCSTGAGTQTCSLNTNTFTTGTQVGTTGAVNAMVVVPGGTATEYSIIIGGALTKYNNVNQKYLSKLDCNATTGLCVLDPTFVGTTTTDGANNIINTIALIPGGNAANYSILIGGTFTGFYGINPDTGAKKLFVQNRLAKITCANDNGVDECSLEPGFVGDGATDGANGIVETIVVYDNGVVVIGGAFTSYDGILRNRVAQLEAEGRLDEDLYTVLPFGPDNTVQHLLIQTDGKIIVSGLFDAYNGLFSGRIIRLLGMTSARSAQGCAAGLFYCGFDNSCVANASQCASCPAGFVQKFPTIPPVTSESNINPPLNTWATTPISSVDFTPRAGHDVAVVNGKIYVFGGQTNKTEMYDPMTNTWTPKAPYPLTGSVSSLNKSHNIAYGIMVSAVGDKIYTFVGLNTYEYDTVRDIWTPKKNNTIDRRFGSAETVDGKIYVIGGLNSKKNQIYNPVTDTWSDAADIPTPGYASYGFTYTQSAVVGGKIYLVGGVNMKTFQYYDPCSNSWVRLPDITIGPVGGGLYSSHSTVAINGDIYVTGGISDQRVDGATLNVHWKYSTANQTWTNLTSTAPLPRAAFHLKGAVVGGKIYAISGASRANSAAPGYTIGYVYNAANSITVDESVSACSCQPACGEGKYYSVTENICRPSHELVGENFCNKNSICEAGESCNCGDCTNGGLDDKDACGLSNGVQMYCSRDDEFYFPDASESPVTFTDSDAFLQSTNSTVFDYSYKVPPAKRFSGASGVNSQVATVPFGPPSNITLISRGGGGGSTYGTDYVWFSYGKVPGNSIFNTMASMSFNNEAFDLKFPNPVKAFGIDIYEMHNTPAGYMGCNTTCTESTFSFRLLKNGVEVSPANNLTFAPANNTDQFFGFSTPFEFDEVQIREKVGSHDNERFGRIYYQDRSAGAERCEMKKVLMTSTAAYPTNNYLIFYDYTPREVIYNGKKVYVYNPIGNTTQSLATITADPSLAYSKIKKFTTPFQFMDHKLTPTNSTSIFNDTGVGVISSPLLCFIKANGVEQCQYDNAQVGYPVFAKTPSTGVSTDIVYATTRDDTGSVTYARADIVRAFDVEVCQPTSSDICTVGACCPAGKKWDCDTNSCILNELICPAGQVKTVSPESPVCILSVVPNAATTYSDVFLTGYEHISGNCAVAPTVGALGAAITRIPPSAGLSVSADVYNISARTDTIFLTASQVTLLLTCPASNTAYCKQGDSVGTFTCGCYPNALITPPESIDTPEYACEIQGCAEGEYYCDAESTCKMASQPCGTVTCNTDGTCDEDESCNCADCNDQIDHCGKNSGEQMTCTKDVIVPAATTAATTAPNSAADRWEAYSYSPAYIFLAKHPITSNTVAGQTFQVYNPERIIFNMTKEQFLANPTAAINNARVIPIGRTRVPTSRLQFNLPQLLSETPAVQATTVTNLKSSILSRFLCKTLGIASTDCHANNLGAFIPAFSYNPTGAIYSSYTDGAGYVGTTAYQRFGTFDVACQPYDYTTVRYLPNTDPRTQGWATSKGIGTAQNDAGKLVWQVNDGSGSDGSTASIYKKLASEEIQQFATKGGKVSALIKNLSSGTTVSPDNAAHLIASYLELSVGSGVTVAGGSTKPVRRYTLTFGLDANKVPTVYGLTDANYFTNPTATPYKYKVDGGADKYNLYEMVYDPTNATVDVFINGVERISNYPGNNVASGNTGLAAGSAVVFFGSGSSAGVAKTNYGEIKLTIKNNACTNVPPVVSQVGACCPDGKQWNSTQNACVVIDQCQPLVTLKKGLDLTLVKNAGNEAFSTNAQCANKDISIAPCSLTVGAVPSGNSPNGNKLFTWPKIASGLSKDYNLVEINGQCWFADNLEETPSNVPTTPGDWDNNAPHNDYGLYTYAGGGTGVSRPEGYLYQFDAATNMTLPGGAPLVPQQGVCPSGWHVATDCEYQYVEHTLGMTVAEQQAVGVRASGSVGTALKVAGNSGLDITLSGARRYNTGFINGGSEGHFWSSECLTTGCYKRIFNVADGSIRRIQGSGVDNSYDSAHHASGSIRCVMDGKATPVNTCPLDKCTAGNYYCDAEKKCKPAGEACITVTCNNNGTCNANESCNCADCTDGNADDKDKCGLDTSGGQMVCTKDINNSTTAPATTQVGACCPAGLKWSSATSSCMADKCVEGQYYCSSENKCKPANEPCTTFTCDTKIVFNYTGAVQNYIVPADVKALEIKAWGAAGGAGYISTRGTFIGAAGGYAQGKLPVTSGQTLAIVVGQGGRYPSTDPATSYPSFGGGGAGLPVWGGSGGGLSGVFLGSFTHSNARLIAGGGSGASGGANQAQGFGGGLQGHASLIDYFSGGFAGGGTQTAGGVGTSPRSATLIGTAGGPLQGGTANSVFCTDGGAGGGGGGYYGGAGGLGDWCNVSSPSGDTDGGGGSGYLHASLIDASFATATVADAKTPPNKSDTDYIAGLAEGKATGDKAGGNGLVVIRECRPTPSVTCDNDTVCDANESCDCSDCNEKVDHCGKDGTGQQLICTKDTVEPCFTDKFPYCLSSACLDGYTRNASGQCEPTTTPTTTTPPTTFACQNRAQSTFDMIEAKLAPYLSQPGNLNITAGEFGTAQTEFEMTQDTRQDNAPSFTKEESWARVKELLSIPDSAQIVWTKSSNLYSNTAYGGSHRYVHSYVIQISGAAPRQITYATEYLPGYGWRKVYFINKEYPLVDQNGQCLGNNPTGTMSCVIRRSLGTESAAVACNAGEVRTGGGCANQGAGGAYRWTNFPFAAGQLPAGYPAVTGTGDGWACASGSTGTHVEAFATCCTNTGNGSTIIRESSGTPSAQVECQAGETRIGGGCKNTAGGAYMYRNYPISIGDDPLGENGPTATQDGWACLSGSSGNTITAYALCRTSTGESPLKNVTVKKGTAAGEAVSCDAGQKLIGGGYSNNDGGGSYAWVSLPMYTGDSITNAFWTEIALKDQYFATSGSSGTSLTAYALCAPVTTTTAGNSCQNFTYPIEGNGFVKNDSASVTKYCTQKSFTSGSVVSTDSNGAGTSTWNGTAWTFSGASQTYSKEIQCCGGTVSTPVCQSYPNAQAHGGYLHMAPPSITKFCKESGFDYASLKSWYMQSGSLRLWNGTSWYEDITGGAVQDMQCCKNPTNASANTTTIAVPQLGACCPPGSAWNSTANACLPSTCGEGKFYCAAQNKCLVGGTPCNTNICVDNGVCSGEESCQCADCTDGGADDKDKCSIIGGVQALCSDDNRGDNKPGACCIPPKRWDSTANTGAGACVECTNTQAPSELQAGVDQPYITCHGNGNTAKTHFRYKLTKIGSSDTPFVSEITLNKTPVLHTTLLQGEYRVECFYGNSAVVDTGLAVSPDTCTKNISVKGSGDTAAQGCSRIYAYRGMTLSDEMRSQSKFDASFRCGSRLPSSGVNKPYMLQVGTNMADLIYDGNMSVLFNELAIGPVSSQTNDYEFDTGSTDVSCSVKVGGGYSTNKSCQLRTCVGGECARPQTFSVVHSANAICTTSPEDDYSIGCNPDAPDANRTACTNWFKTNFDINAGKTKFNIPFTMNGRVRDIECTIIPANSPLLGGLNMYENYACSTKLPNGETVQLFNGDVSLQTTAYTVKFDDIDPTASDIVYYTDTTLSTLATEINKWQKKPITAQVTCVDRPTEESTSCACAKVVDAGTTAATALWSQGVPDARLGADIMRYTRTFTTTTPAQKIKVRDTANNASPEKDIPAISIDTQPPVVTIAESGTGATKTLTFTISDSASKIWKATGTPSTTPASTNIQSLIYKKVPKADANIALYDENCGLPLASTNYASVTDTAALPAALPALPITGVNLNTEVLSYCIQDNAGNVTRGVYPSEITGCFSATNMSPVPTLSTYKTGLQANITANKFGYGLSEDPANATCFRGILSNNITTLVTNQYNARTTNTLSWSQPATLKSNAALANTNGYYYHSFTANTTSSSPLNVSTNNTVTLGTPAAPSPTGTGQKIVVVDGGNIQINNNIDYSGSDKTLVLIARKINNSGGNIFIDPSVTRIDAILIADGALMNGITTNSGTTSSTTSLKNWIDHANELSNRLIINGRLYSFNTRGGSLDTTLKPLTTNIGKYFDQIQLKSDATPAKAASMDLEGFRIVNSVGSQTCSLSLNYRVFTSLSLPTILQRPVGYGGGTCSF